MITRLAPAGTRRIAVVVTLELAIGGACTARREAGPADTTAGTSAAATTAGTITAASTAVPVVTSVATSVPTDTATATSTTLPEVTAATRPTTQPPDATPTGSTARSVTVDGIARAYRLYAPAVLPPGPVPVVVMFHGGFGSGEQAEAAYGWDAAADAHGFVVVYPDGVGRTWNAGSCCGRAAREDIDDIGFVRAVLDDLDGVVARDPARTFAAGMSNGALLAYRLACETTLFAAIAAVAGTIATDTCLGQPTSVLAVHGLADASVRVDGGPGGGPGRVDGWPIADVIAHWREIGGCESSVTRPATDPHVTIDVAPCPGGREVTLVVIDDAGHQWPGGEPGRASADPPSERFDATGYAWEFFAAHPGG
jgi:polyhydroxybutyrate depolymerase